MIDKAVDLLSSVFVLDDLNFQVGMAHFTEDQHDCIMDTLMAMFCYKHTKVNRPLIELAICFPSYPQYIFFISSTLIM